MSKPALDDLLTFSGRRNRKSYLVLSLLSMVVLGFMWFGLAVMVAGSEGPGLIGGAAGVVALTFSAVVVIANMIAAAQRCRDFGWTGWAILLTLMPVVGWMFALALYVLPGNPGPNRYGPDPLETP